VKGNEFTILTATMGVDGTFSSFYDPLKGNYSIKMDVLYSANDVTLAGGAGHVQAVCVHGQPASVAANLDSFSGLGTTNGDPRGAALITYLNTIPGAQFVGGLGITVAEEYHGDVRHGIRGGEYGGGKYPARVGRHSFGGEAASGSLSLSGSRLTDDPAGVGGPEPAADGIIPAGRQ